MYNGKRAFDLTLTLATAPLWIPVLACVALVVRVVIGAPVMFRQARAGRYGQEFMLVKFRTMTDERDSSGQLLPDEARLTRAGAFLRSTSLDELPELWNVLRGDMSVVGPRPLHLRYLDRYSQEHALRHDVRPGLTGLAQVSGRNQLSWPARFDLDVLYVREQSLALDLRIIARTIRVVLRRSDVSATGEATAPEFLGYGSGDAAE